MTSTQKRIALVVIAMLAAAYGAFGWMNFGHIWSRPSLFTGVPIYQFIYALTRADVGIFVAMGINALLYACVASATTTLAYRARKLVTT